MKIISNTLALLLCAQVAIAQHDDHAKYAIKFSPTQMIAGELHFEYEQAVGNQLSVYANLGPTFSEKNLQRVFLDEIYNGNLSREADLGFFGGIGVRYYVFSNYSTAIRGMYVGPEFKYRVYNSMLGSNNMQPNFNTDLFHYSAKQFSFRMQLGYQFMVGGRLAMDLFLNFGFGKTIIDTYDNEMVYNNETGVMESGYRDIKRSHLGLVGVSGLKIGIGTPKKK